MNDTLLQTIEGSKLIADDALDSLTEPARMREAMGRLSYWLGEATADGQRGLNSLQLRSYDGDDLVSGLRRAAEECLNHGSLGFVFSVNGESRDIYPAVRDKVCSLGFEAISHACKHIRAGRLEVRLSYGLDLEVEIGATGHTPESNSDASSDELLSDFHEMQSRAKRFGGTLNVTKLSASDLGFTITVPGRVVFLDSPAISPKWLVALWYRLWP